MRAFLAIGGSDSDAALKSVTIKCRIRVLIVAASLSSPDPAASLLAPALPREYAPDLSRYVSRNSASRAAARSAARCAFFDAFLERSRSHCAASCAEKAPLNVLSFLRCFLDAVDVQ